MLRRTVKRLLFGPLGRFPYYGETVFFPRNSFLFALACEQGIYEHANVRLLLTLVKRGTHYFDVGANIGLMAVPILRTIPECRVVSFEPSPKTLPYLRRTAEHSSFGSRWEVVDKAVAASPGVVSFRVAQGGMGAFDGLHDTNRIECGFDVVKVPATTIDAEWLRLGKPSVSAMKIDVEGAELEVLQGAVACIAAERPSVLIEWNHPNSRAAGRSAGDLLSAAARLHYSIYCLPHMVPVRTVTDLAAQMIVSEDFLLVSDRSG